MFFEHLCSFSRYFGYSIQALQFTLRGPIRFSDRVYSPAFPNASAQGLTATWVRRGDFSVISGPRARDDRLSQSWGSRVQGRKWSLGPGGAYVTPLFTQACGQSSLSLCPLSLKKPYNLLLDLSTLSLELPLLSRHRPLSGDPPPPLLGAFKHSTLFSFDLL